ncbi:GNAT family N-acetyltransferase [Streptomyces lunaelactis]|uniref:GNAT family N-acetyltransferase n=1 Tax=Streptomyces lunaelactis TaxID=1535768 RepID=UPI001584B58A|nr:GNAT family N-acetyltransferase [Streptomyces lunaelactis]NUK53169.1 GNAT family N-acetyltransferase [Streptomyces lunaelactis]NUK66704.1 GNAT family N-acetyltransferase [Streptomyces lunaelactis]
MLRNAAWPDGIVRPATPDDLPALAGLCAAHAAFEQAGPVPGDLADRLEPALFRAPARVWCLVADGGGKLLGYATYTLEFSTWLAAEYVHLDCLFVAERHRGGGWGRRLLDAVTAAATARGMTQVQWQTPDWNSDAIRFYDRTGAQSARKVRYLLPVPSGQEKNDLDSSVNSRNLSPTLRCAPCDPPPQ